MIALFQDALAASFDEMVEARRKLSHTLAEVIEAEVDARESVEHGWGFGGEVWLPHAACAE